MFIFLIVTIKWATKTLFFFKSENFRSVIDRIYNAINFGFTSLLISKIKRLNFYLS